MMRGDGDSLADDDFEDSPEEDEEFGEDPDFLTNLKMMISEELSLPIEEEIPEDLEPTYQIIHGY